MLIFFVHDMIFSIIYHVHKKQTFFVNNYLYIPEPCRRRIFPYISQVQSEAVDQYQEPSEHNL